MRELTEIGCRFAHADQARKNRMITARDLYKKLSSFGMIPSGDASKAWLTSAEQDGVALLTEQESDLVILYASFRHLWIISLFAPTSNLQHPNKDDLYNARIQPDDTWCIQRVWGGGQGHTIYLEPPVEFGKGHPLNNSEPIVFRRSFDGMANYFSPIEISQKLVHSLNLHFMPERNAFCRLDSEGDIYEVIYIFQDKGTDNFDSRALVLIDQKVLAEYMAVGDFALFRKFDVTRFRLGSFSRWEEGSRHFEAPDLFYYLGLSDGTASYIHGGQILRSTVTVDQLIEEWKREEDPNARNYEIFKIHDWKNKRYVEWSSSPSELSNYFTKSEKPFEISPAFFSPEVLTKYKANPDKYDLDDRSITCRNSWYLKTYDVNEAGQVHTYIGYLQSLPYKEQQHWRLYNEWPKSGLSKRAIETDFEGKWASDADPLESLRYSVEELDINPPPWWSSRGADVRNRVHYPVTTSSKEWADELLSLDQMLVEGFVATELKKIATESGIKIENQWQSLKTIQELLRARGYASADELVAPLRQLHHLRNKITGHRTDERAKLEAEAFKEYGSYRAHFQALCTQCDKSLSAVMAALAND
jgi:hypothetical protein